MLTIANRVAVWIEQHPTHASFMQAGLLNSASLARMIKPELEQQASEKLSTDAITLALNRATQKLHKQLNTDFESYIGEVSVQTGLSIMTIPQVGLNLDGFFAVLKELHAKQEYSLYTRGVWHTALIGKTERLNGLSGMFANTIINENVTALTVKLRPGHLPTPGVCAFVMQKLALRGINLLEVASSYDELTMLIDNNDTQAALSCLV